MEETQALAVREETGEIIETEPTRAIVPALHGTLAADPYVGVAAQPFDERAQAVLAKYQDVPDEWLDIKPDGKLYLSHIKARNILNEAFGYGGWALVPVGDYNVEQSDKKVNVYRVYRLYVGGRFHDEAMGVGTYWTNNRDADYADACEASKSYALNRLCKTFNIAQRCWDKAFTEEWKAKYAYRDANDGNKWKKRLAPQPKPAAAPKPQPAPETDVPNPGEWQIAKVTTKEGKGKKWAVIETIDGPQFNTWHTGATLVLLADAVASGAVVRIAWKRTTSGNYEATAIELAPIDAEEGE